ncbi:MAG: cell division protein FtsB [Sulfuriflexus sp.]|nr:cell division protein FtsB [Sulfuriflexus sp.]
MKLLFAGLLVLFITLQLTLWFGEGGLVDVRKLQQQIEQQQAENARLNERNAALEAEVKDFKQGLGAIEERARNELGMIKKDETFFQIIEQDKPDKK